MKLEYRLGLGMGILVLFMVLAACVTHFRLQQEDDLSSTVVTVRSPAVRQLRDSGMRIAASVMELQQTILPDSHTNGHAIQHTERMADLLAVQHSMGMLMADRDKLQSIDRDRLLDLKLKIDQIAALEDQVEHLAPGNVDAQSILREAILPLERTIMAVVAEASESEVRQMSADLDELRQKQRMTLALLWLATALGALLGGPFTFWVGRSLGHALEKVARRANAIATGDLTGRPMRARAQDQIGDLAEAMNRMQDSLGSVIGMVADTAGSLTGSVVSMRSASDQMHKRIDQQSQQTQQAATAMQEMCASIAEVSRHTQSAAETARGAAQTARVGGAIVKQMLGSMHEIATSVSDTSETVGMLGEDSKRISQIVNVIDEIARKTNLLALNAAIEAARAGEQGRGFAVVAGEVRRLAESTAQATGEIGAMIAGIQERTRNAIASMETGTGTVREGVVTTTQAGEALERIIGMAERVDRMITQIAIAASQQATAADQSSASLDSIHSLSHDNLTEMATTAAGIESMRGTAVRLEKQVDRFHVMGKAA